MEGVSQKIAVKNKLPAVNKNELAKVGKNKSSDSEKKQNVAKRRRVNPKMKKNSVSKNGLPKCLKEKISLTKLHVHVEDMLTNKHLEQMYGLRGKLKEYVHSKTYGDSHSPACRSKRVEVMRNLNVRSPSCGRDLDTRSAETKLTTVSPDLDLSSEKSRPTTINEKLDSAGVPHSAVAGSDVSVLKSRTSSTVQVNANQSASRLHFGVPFLPPAKRPATRIKPSLGSSLCKMTPSSNESVLSANSKLPSLLSIQNNDSIHVENGDEISVCASSSPSIGYLDKQSSAEQPVKLPNSRLSERELQELQNLQHNDFEDEETVDEDVESLHSLENDSKFENCEHIPEVTKRPYCNFRLDVPFIFSRLCYYHFKFENCHNGRFCSRMHDVSTDIKIKIKSLLYEQLVKAYAFAKERHLLYIETFDYFIEAFRNLNCVSELITSVGDILNSSIYNKTPYVDKILSYLCDIGMPFLDGVSKIVAAHSMKSTTLTDILLDIICVRRKVDLVCNWHVVQHLIKNTAEPIDHGLVGEIMTMCYQDKNTELAKSIVTDIIRPVIVDLKMVNIDTLNNFLSMLQSYKLHEEQQVLVEKMKLCSVSVIYPLCADSENQNLTLHTLPAKNENSKSHRCRSPSSSASVHGRSDIVLSASEQNAPVYAHTVMFQNTGSQNMVIPANSSSSCHKATKNMNSENTTNTLKFIDDIGPKDISDDIETEKPSSSKSYHELSLMNSQKRPTLSQWHDVENIVSEDCYSLSSSPDNSENKNVNSNSNPLGLNLNFNNNGILSPSYSSDFIRDNSEGDTAVLPEEDLLRLKNSIQNRQYMEFLDLLYTYREGKFTRQFVLNVVVYLKSSKTGTEISSMVIDILTAIEALYPDRVNHSTTDVLSMLAINVIGLLEDYHLYKEASDILLKFCKNLESLKKTVWFSNGFHRYRYTDSGKYLYFCKIFVKGHCIKQAWNILSSPELQLLYVTRNWRWDSKQHFDNKFRDCILRELIEVALLEDIEIAKNVLLFIIEDNHIVTEIDIWKYFNQLLLKMLDESKYYLEDLLNMKEDITEKWYKYLYESVMRGLLVCFLPEISSNDTFEFYSRCCSRNCYPYIKGNETTITLKVDMVAEEIYTILRVYLYKKVKNRFRLTDVVLRITLPDVPKRLPKILSNSHTHLQEVKQRIYHVLANKLHCEVAADNCNTEKPRIIIKANQLRACFNDELKWHQRR